MFLIDTTTRALRVLSVDLAELPHERRFHHDPLTRVVARVGAEVGLLPDLVRARGVFDAPLMLDAVLVPLAGYQAHSSEGYVRALWRGPAVELAATLGCQLFGRAAPEALRLLRRPVQCGVLEGVEIRRVATHGNPSRACALAAQAGLELRHQATRLPLIVEGQSNRTRAFELRGTAPEQLVLPEEHQEWVASALSARAETAIAGWETL